MFARLFFLLLFLPGIVSAQQYRGRIYDATSFTPVGNVLITNTRTSSLWLSDASGMIAFTAAPGDIMTFTNRYYKPAQLMITSFPQVISIAMNKAPIELAGVEVLSPLARYQRDSASNRQLYRKQLGYAHSRPEYSIGGGNATAGVGANGLVSELALLVSGKKKAAKRLEAELLYLEGLQYASIRYTPWLVSAQTGLEDSAAIAFIVRNPIPNDFLRLASELELKMRIRELYRAETSKAALEKVGAAGMAGPK